MIDNLEKHGLVRRVRSLMDRRMILIELTDEGCALIKRTFPKHVAAVVAEMGVLTQEEQERLGDLSRKLGLGEKG